MMFCLLRFEYRGFSGGCVLIQGFLDFFQGVSMLSRFSRGVLLFFWCFSRVLLGFGEASSYFEL